MPMISMEVDLKTIHGSKKKGDTELKAIDGDGFVSGVAQCQHWDTAPCTMTHKKHMNIKHGYQPQCSS